jgi:hypothetical protein
MLKLKFQKLHEEFFHVLYRFPLAVLSSLFLTIYVMNPSFWPESWHKQALISIFVINILWFVSIELIAESQKWSKAFSTTLALSVFGLIAQYLYTLSPVFPSTLLMAFGFITLIFVAPFMGKSLNREYIWYYHYKLGINAVFALLLSFIICSGIGLILISLDYLFHVILIYDQYEKLVKITVCFFMPLILMLGIPSRFNEPVEKTQIKNVQFLLNYVMTPILLVFGLILVVYSIKIFIAQNLPRGKVAYLVACLGAFGCFAYLLGDTAKMSLSVMHKFFRKHFFHLMIIPLVLMGIGIGVRVHQYGLTISRYFVCLVFANLLIITTYSFVGSWARITRFMLIWTSSLFLLGSFGPWGIVELSSFSQFKRLQHLLEKNHILENDKILKIHPPVDLQDEVEINNTINYIIAHGNPKMLKGWFGLEDQKLFDIPDQSKLNGKDLTLLMGIQSGLVPKSNLKNDTFSFKRQVNNSKWVPLEGQNYLLKDFHFNTQNFSQVEEVLPGPSKIIIKIKFDKDSQKLSFERKNGSESRLTIDLRDMVSKLRDERDLSVIDKNLVFEGRVDTLYLKFIIQKISAAIEERGDLKVTDMTGDLFIKTIS